MELKSAAWHVAAFFAVFCAAILVASIGQRSKVFQAIAPAHSPEINSLSAEEINQRTHRLADTIKPSTK